jgi:hypothetical protein
MRLSGDAPDAAAVIGATWGWHAAKGERCGRFLETKGAERRLLLRVEVDDHGKLRVPIRASAARDDDDELARCLSQTLGAHVEDDGGFPWASRPGDGYVIELPVLVAGGVVLPRPLSGEKAGPDH